MGNKVTFSRGVARILDDLKTVRPSIMMSVPRVFEKVAAKINERLKQKGAVSRLVSKLLSMRATATSAAGMASPSTPLFRRHLID